MMGLETLAGTYLKRMNKLDSTNILLRFIHESGLDVYEIDKIDKNDVIIKMLNIRVNTDLNLDEVGGYIKKNLAILKNHELNDYGGSENDREVFEG